MSAQRARSAVETAHRSVHPNIPGVPWWTALLIAVTATAVGYGIDAGHKELTHVFAGFYIAGCVAAVLAVRQEGLFTAVIQPPLILFCAVPGAYWLFHGGKIGHLKDLLINCGYPLIERFPLMLGTAGGVLLIGLLRWYFGMSHRLIAADKAGNADDADASAPAAHSVVKDIAARLHALLRPRADGEDADESRSSGARRSRAGTTASTARRRSARGTRTTTRTTRGRSRHARQPLDDERGATAERPRRSSRRGAAPARDYDAAQPPRRSRRRPRPEPDSDPRGQLPPREPRPRRSPYERPAPRSSRFDGYDRYDLPGASERYGRYDTHERYDRRHEPAGEPKRRRATNGAESTHHPISQVRYRATAPVDESRAEPRGQYRPRSRSNGRFPAESWEHDA
ncbi:DUF6542 domain-containing protein [Mycobacterium sp. HUMS_1102779]|uniref:DUF6542 domain-containing protein n=1 Tax=Mycobacterium sp. HUMS_1102779 TaxID=3383487 RepID=UPI003899C96C